MRIRLGLLLILATVLTVQATAQTIQLPSIHEFSTDTTVVVPDRGNSWVAGSKRAASGTNRIGGIPAQRAGGVERQASGAAVAAQIHDPAEADQALLKQAQAQRAMMRAQQPSTPNRAKTDDLAMKPNDPGLQSIADIQCQRARQAAADQRESQALLAKARQARVEGKTSLATHYYRSASLQADRSTRQTINAEIRNLTSGAKPSTPSSPTAAGR